MKPSHAFPPVLGPLAAGAGTRGASARGSAKSGATIHTDALRSYDGLEAEYVHQVIRPCRGLRRREVDGLLRREKPQGRSQMNVNAAGVWVSTSLLLALGVVVGCGTTSPESSRSTPLILSPPSASATVAAPPSESWTTQTYLNVTVSYPASWSERNVYGLIELVAPDGATVSFGGPTGGSWSAATCDQYARAQGGAPDGQTPITIDGVTTTEYTYAKGAGKTGYEIPVFLRNGACESIVASPNGGDLDHETLDRTFHATRYNL